MNADAADRLPAYRRVRDFLAQHTNVVELTDNRHGRLIVCPDYQGRVMTSTLDGEDGLSFGFICYDFIESGKKDAHFNNFGGEERMWISPEGGQFSLWFAAGLKTQKIEDWFTPKDINEGSWEVVSRKDDSSLQMQREMHLQNTSGTEFDIMVARQVRMLSDDNLAKLFGQDTAELLRGGTGKYVAFETVNSISNKARAWSRKTGLISIWMLGMLNSSPKNIIIVPYIQGNEAELGTPVRADYFGKLGPDRLRIIPGAIFLRADANYRSKLGTSKRRAVDVLGSIDFENNVLTLVKFSLPENTADQPYLNNLWQNPLEEPYDGDVINAYNDGPSELGSQMGKFYELETLSPARELATGETLTHRNRTVHIQADPATLGEIARRALGVELETVRREMNVE